MMQRWRPEAVRFMKNASEYGDHYARLASELLPYLPENGHVCDAGCGLGYLSLELAKYCRNVTAIDRSEAALDVLRGNRPPQNLQIVCGDVFEMQECYDAVVMCYFGHTDEIFRLASRCRGNMIVLRRDCSRHKFSIGEVKRSHENVLDLREELTKRGVSYEARSLHIELGQPFTDIDDAINFFRLYNKSDKPVERGAVLHRLSATGRKDYPWYLPGQRDMELTVFPVSQIH